MAWIKKVYLYLVSLVSLIILIIAGIMLINMALKTWVFTKADKDFYYNPVVNCTPPPGVDASGSLTSSYMAPPECTDPEYQKGTQESQSEQRSAQKQRDAAQALAMIIVATPVFLYHWKLARKEA